MTGTTRSESPSRVDTTTVSAVDRPVVAQVVHTLNVGGAEILARRYALTTIDQFSPLFVCLDQAGGMASELTNQGHPVEVLGRRAGIDFAAVRRFRQLFRDRNVALIHAHQYGPFFYAAAARGLARRPPILFLEHGRDYPDYPRPKRKLANRFLLGRRDRVVAVGDVVKQALIANEGLPADRIDVIYNGIDVTAAEPFVSQRNAIRQAEGWTHQLIVIQVARLNRLKNHRLALRTIDLVRQTIPNVRLVLVGDGDERPAIEEQRRSLGLENHVTLLGERTDIPRLLAGADVFLLTSVTEGIALSLCEAMAARLPCVATNVGGNGEVIADAQTGTLAPVDDPAALAGALVAMLQSADQRRQFGTAARARAVERFDERRMVAAYRDLYEEMTGWTVDKQ